MQSSKTYLDDKYIDDTDIFYYSDNYDEPLNTMNKELNVFKKVDGHE